MSDRTFVFYSLCHFDISIDTLELLYIPYSKQRYQYAIAIIFGTLAAYAYLCFNGWAECNSSNGLVSTWKMSCQILSLCINN
jgi:hypothetical protein